MFQIKTIFGSGLLHSQTESVLFTPNLVYRSCTAGERLVYASKVLGVKLLHMVSILNLRKVYGGGRAVAHFHGESWFCSHQLQCTARVPPVYRSCTTGVPLVYHW